MRRVRPPKSQAFLKLSFAPGECAQVDWGCYGAVNVGNTTRRLSFFVMVLCYSRMMYVEFTVSQTMEHFLGCHHNAFDFFGCVPKKIMVDYVPRNIIDLMWPSKICAVDLKSPLIKRWSSRISQHNIHSD